MDNKERSRLILAIKRCIAATFTTSDWDELAYITNGHEIIYDHPRLLRSFHFGDEDYDGHIFGVIEDLVRIDPVNLQRLIDHLDLQEWLKQNSPKDFEELYGFAHPLLDGVEEKAITNSFDLHQHIRRIRHTIESDPELAIGSTKEMLESVLKNILEAKGEIVGKEDLPKLLKRVQKILNLDPSDVDQNAKGAETVKRTLSSLGQIVSGIDELRNMYGTGHGRQKQSGVKTRHARLVVNSGAAISIFLMETFEHYQTNEDL